VGNTLSLIEATKQVGYTVVLRATYGPKIRDGRTVKPAHGSTSKFEQLNIVRWYIQGTM